MRMRRNREVLWVVVAVVASLGILWASPGSSQQDPMAELAAKARQEGGVINTYGMPEDWANYKGIFGEFERRYGIRQQDIDMGSAVVLARVTEEKASKNDIMETYTGFAQQLAERGLTSDYRPRDWARIPEVERGVSANGSVWQSAFRGTVCFLVNTRQVKNVPTTWRALENPEYKGLMSYMDPRATGTGVAIVEAISYAFSGDPSNYKVGAAFLGRLHKMGLIASVDPKISPSRFQRGEVAIFINVDYNLLRWKDELGVPSVVVIPADGSISIANGVLMAKNAPHPNTARLFMEFLYSAEGQRLFAEGYVAPIRQDIAFPPELAAKFPPREQYQKVTPTDYRKEAAIRQELIKTWTQETAQ